MKPLEWRENAVWKLATRLPSQTDRSDLHVSFPDSNERYRPYGLRFMVHPRARVAIEERGQWVPGWLLRYL